VFGATPAGIVAAVAARRAAGSKPLRVTLVEPSPWIGGMMAGGLGCTDKVHATAVGGMALEVINRTQAAYPPGRRLPHCTHAFEPHVARNVFHAMLAEAGVQLLLNHSLLSLRKGAANRLLAATFTTPPSVAPVRDTATVAASVFIDASYEGDLMAMAGVSFTIGRESRAQYGEQDAGRQPLRPGSCYGFQTAIDPFGLDGKPLPLISRAPLAQEYAGDDKVMAYNYRLCLTNATQAARRVEITEPPDYDAAFFEAPRRYMLANPPAQLTTTVLKIYEVARVGDGVKADVNAAVYPFSTDFVGGSWGYPNGTAAERQAIIARHRTYTKGLLWFLRSDKAVPAHIRAEMSSWAWCADEFRDNDNFPFQLYVREARRMIGATVVTAHNINASVLADGNASIGVAAYAMDVHPVEIVVDSIMAGCSGSHTCENAGGGGGGGDIQGRQIPASMSTSRAVVEGCIHLSGGPLPEFAVGPWEVPYAAITPKETELCNLLVPVALSASHVAFATIRLELTWMVLGQSAGLAAAMAVALGVSVQSVPLPALHAALLASGQVLKSGK